MKNLSAQLLKLAEYLDQDVKSRYMTELENFSEKDLESAMNQLKSAHKVLKKGKSDLQQALSAKNTQKLHAIMANLDDKLQKDLNFSNFLREINGMHGVFAEITKNSDEL